MEMTLLFVASGDFRNQESYSSLKCPTLGQEQMTFFFSCSFPPFDSSKHFTYHRIDLAVNGEIDFGHTK